MSFIEFLLEYYIYILSVLVVIIIGVIGFLVDTKNKEKKQKVVVSNNEVTQELGTEPISVMNQNVDANLTLQPLTEVSVSDANNVSNSVNGELVNNYFNETQVQPVGVGQGVEENVYMNQQPISTNNIVSNQMNNVPNNVVIGNVESSNVIPVQNLASAEMMNTNTQMINNDAYNNLMTNVASTPIQNMASTGMMNTNTQMENNGSVQEKNMVNNSLQSNLYNTGLGPNYMSVQASPVDVMDNVPITTSIDNSNNSLAGNAVNGFNYQQVVQPSVVPVDNAVNQNLIPVNSSIQSQVNMANNVQPQSNVFNIQASNVPNYANVNNMQNSNVNGMMGQNYNNMVNNNPVFTSDGSQPFDVSNMFGNNQQ